MASSADRDAARRREILEAAKTCFLKFGYGKTSLDDIARAAGLSRPLLYRKFANKEAIFTALYDDVFLGQLRKADAVLATRGGKADKLARACELACVEPYAMILGAPMAEEFWHACNEMIPEILDDHRRRWRALLGRLLPRDRVEVFDLALDGMYADMPSLAVLRKRIGVLIASFT
ncbi:MAG TPA: helix-turn-helix domain-containing protein [Kofleriaceae bacterium]|nr:helix-turn-helix domain-containing protein [Kofleriaceae bacterium]